MEEDIFNGDSQPRKKKRNIGKKLKTLLTVLLSFALIGAALLGILYRDKLSAEGIRRLFGRELSFEEEMEPFSYENGSSLAFAPAGEGFAVASTSGLQLLDGSGRTVVKEISSMESPAVSASASAALFFDIGGSSCTLAKFDGSRVQLDVGESIVSAAMNASGYFAVISEDAGSKGLVQVFDSGGELLYQWYSGSGYALKAVVSPDNKRLAVLCAESGGSYIHLLRLNSETELAKYAWPGKLLFDMNFLSSGSILALSEEACYALNTDSGEQTQYSFGGKHMAAYELSGSGFAAIYLSDYSSGSAGKLLSLDGSGKLLGETEISGSLISLSASGRQLLVCCTGGLSLYNSSMELQKSEESLMTAKKALLRPKGDVLLLSSYAAEIFHF